jgi:hypothetical protein
VPADRTTLFPKERAAALLQAVCYHKPPDITGYWTVAMADLTGVEDGLEKYLADQGRKPRDNWADYERQVAGVLCDANRFVFLSYFIPDPTVRPPAPEPGEANLPQPYWMNDGGDTYFRVMYDPARKEFTWFERNSDA